MKIVTRRVYDWQPDSAEYAVLVDRLWPRGIAKERLADARWDKEVAPSAELRRRYHSGALAFADFAEAYTAELDSTDACAELLADARADGAATLVLLYAAKDPDQNHALVLAEHLRGTPGDGSTG